MSHNDDRSISRSTDTARHYPLEFEEQNQGQKGEKKGRDAFIPFADIREILDGNTIHKLFRCYDGSDDKQPTATRRSASQYLKVLATLIHIYTDNSLSKVVRYIKGHSNSHDSWVPPSDDRLPVTLEAAQRCFGEQEGYFFFSEQFVFCALVIREDGYHQIFDHDRPLFPFVSEKFKDEGAIGAVYKVKLARGHWLDSNGVSNNVYEKELAQKRFNVEGKNNAKKNKEKFYGELEKLKELRRSPRSHKNINLHLASFDVGSKYSMFYELAEKDLDKFLFEPVTPDRWEWWQKAALMENATDVLDALAWLHDFRPDCAVYHFDISPKNILIFKERRESAYIEEPHRIRQTAWKLSDFDLSEFKYTEFLSSASREGWKRSGTSSVSCTLEPSSYRSPEVFYGSRIGPESDVWSFACIFSLVLSYLHDRGKGVHNFQKALLRETPNGNGKWDYFFDPASVPEQSIRIHSSVKEWFEILKEKQECLHHREYVKQVTGSLVSEIFDKPEKSKRLKAASLHEILWREFKKFCGKHQRNDSLTEEHPPVRLEDLRLRSICGNQDPEEGKDYLGRNTNANCGPHSIAIDTPIFTPVPPSTPRPASPSGSGPRERSEVIPEVNISSPASSMDGYLPKRAVPTVLPVAQPTQSHRFPDRPKCADFSAFCNDPNSHKLKALLDSDARYHLTKKCRHCNYTPLERAAESPEILRDMIQDARQRAIDLNLNSECVGGVSLFTKCCIEKRWESAIILKENGAKTIDREKLKRMRIPPQYKKALLL